MNKFSQLSTGRRTYYGLVLLVGVLLVSMVAATFGVNKILTTKATSLTSLKAQDQALNQEQAGLAQAKKDVATYAPLQQITQSIVPEDKDQAESVREIVNIAAANKVSLAAINFPASTLGSATIGSATGVSTTTPSASTGGRNSKLSQLQPVKNIPGVYDLQIIIQGDPNKPVAYDAFVNFLAALEHNRRTAQISAISINPSTTNHALLTFSLTVNEYIKP